MSYVDQELSTFEGKPVELYHFETADEEWFLTSADATITDDGNDYEPIALIRSSIGQNSELGGGSMEIEIPSSHPIAERFKPYAPSTPMSLTIYRKHVGVDDRVTAAVGRIVAASYGDKCTLRFEPDSGLLKKRLPPQKFQRPCSRILYDVGCGMNPEDFKIVATVTAISHGGATLVAAEFDSEDDQWLRNGYVKIGEQRRMVVDHQGDTVIVLAPFIDIEAPVAANAFAGCNRSYSECVNKFDNLKRFLGFPWTPARNPFDGLG
jgi:uncharacterized phage protein (TIGR02218 family)